MNRTTCLALLASLSICAAGCRPEVIDANHRDPAEEPGGDPPGGAPGGGAPAEPPPELPKTCDYFEDFHFVEGPAVALRIDAGDVDGDLRSDLWVAGGPLPYLLHSYQSGTFQVLALSPVDGGGATSVKVADVNGDGQLDLVAADPTSVGIWAGDGAGSFAHVATLLNDLSFDTPSFGVEIGDVDGDAIADVLVSDLIGSLTVMRGQGNDAFGGLETYVPGPPWAHPYGVAVGDIDGDGRDEAALAVDIENEGSVVVIYDLDAEPYDPFSGTVLDAGDGARQPRLADFDADGHLDLVVSNDDLVVLIGHGDGSFEIAATCVPDSPTRDLVLADINGDGVLDVATTQADGSPQSVGVMLGVRP